MTQTQAPGPAQPPPFAAMLRATVIPMAVVTPVIVLVFWIAREMRGGLAALLGVTVAVAFFASGLYAMKRISNANPLSVVAGMLAVYLGQMIFLGIVIFGLSDADWLDGLAFGLAVLAVALIWQVVQVWAFMRLRKPVYDEPIGAGEASIDQAAASGATDEQVDQSAPKQLSTQEPLP